MDPRDSEGRHPAQRQWPHSYRPPEKYEEPLSGDDSGSHVPGWLVGFLVGVATLWVITAWILIIRYW